MKKGMKITGIVFGALIAVGIIGNIIDPAPTEQTAAPTVAAPVPAPKAEKAPAPAPAPAPKKEDNVFSFGEEVTFTSGLKVKVLGVTETAERNQFEDPVKHVVIVDIEINNTTGGELTAMSNDFTVQDNEGFQGKTYAGGDQIVTIPANSKAKVKFQYSTDSAGPYKVLGGVATWK